jgi:hypothetical protein
MGRTLAFKNKDDQMVAFAAKSTKALILTQVRLRFQECISYVYAFSVGPSMTVPHIEGVVAILSL